MSKKITTGTKEVILNQALKMFNEDGIESVGLREIARKLGIRVGNITYYFPKKADLVLALFRQLSALNSGINTPEKCHSILDFLEIQRKSYKNQHRFKGLFLSQNLIRASDSEVFKPYPENYKNRISAFVQMFENLQKTKYLTVKITHAELENLAVMVSFIGRFHILDSQMIRLGLKGKQLEDYYLKKIAYLLLPYSTAKGRKVIKGFVDSES